MSLNMIMLRVIDANLLLQARDWYLKYLPPMAVVHETLRKSVFLEHGAAGARLALYVAPPEPTPSAVTLYFELDDVDAWYQQMRGQGLPFDLAPSPRTWGGKVAVVRDPCGHIVKCFSPLSVEEEAELYPLVAPPSEAAHGD